MIFLLHKNPSQLQQANYQGINCLNRVIYNFYNTSMIMQAIENKCYVANHNITPSQVHN